MSKESVEQNTRPSSSKEVNINTTEQPSAALSSIYKDMRNEIQQKIKEENLQKLVQIKL